MACGRCTLLAAMLLMTACQARQADAPVVDDAAVSAATASAASTSPTESPSSAGTAVDSNQPPDSNAAPTNPTEAPVPGVKAGMAYADFRKLLLANGWAPVPTAGCTANVVGGGHESVCKTSPEQLTCKICALMPELDSYSGDGFALVRFKHAASGEVLEATGYGMIEDWNVAGNDSRLQLERWESSGKAKH